MSHNIKFIKDLVSYYDGNWKLIHRDYCKLTGTNVELESIKEISEYEDLLEELKDDCANKINPIINFSNRINDYINNFDKSEQNVESLLESILKLNDFCLKIREINKIG